MGRTKTWKEKEERRLRRRRSNKIVKGNPYIEPEIKPVSAESIPYHIRVIIGGKKNWLTRNSRCPCDSGERFKNCCMAWERG